MVLLSVTSLTTRSIPHSIVLLLLPRLISNIILGVVVVVFWFVLLVLCFVVVAVVVGFGFVTVVVVGISDIF